jgi:hypothetical protein
MFENLGNALDISFSLPNGGSLHAVGVGRDGKTTKVGMSYDDVRMSLKINKDDRETDFALIGDRIRDESIPIDWCRCFVGVLGRQSDQWVGYYDYYDVLSHAANPETPLPDSTKPGWSMEKESAWFDEVIGDMLVDFRYDDEREREENIRSRNYKGKR